MNETTTASQTTTMPAMMMTMTPPTPEFVAEAELYFLPGGHYLFRKRTDTGVQSKFVTAPDVAAAFTGQEMDTGWIPDGVMRIGQHPSGPWYIYTAPPQRVRLTLTDGAAAFEEIEIPIPRTVLFAFGGNYSLAAVKAPRLLPDSKLYAAPFPNLYDSLKICWGSNTPPEISFSSAPKVWKLFFDAPFNGHLAAGKSLAYPKDVREQLLALAASKRRKYPLGDLIETRYTVKTFVDALQRGWV